MMTFSKILNQLEGPLIRGPIEENKHGGLCMRNNIISNNKLFSRHFNDMNYSGAMLLHSLEILDKILEKTGEKSDENLISDEINQIYYWKQRYKRNLSYVLYKKDVLNEKM